ncbi:LTA synthase family protein [Jeongeupia naejangsanensis]|uniref:LTA synthase family protein n=1 Tax=Jeongeupia naejangsanensis TaxID=613195 RepID=A0ABS2BPR9_9NEIS|nr:LTA synthase family protein [Jeongeupia naejangsanensis]MBM3117646.1 LTA synthase family protein [Jeongeupia naejangsanensis]
MQVARLRYWGLKLAVLAGPYALLLAGRLLVDSAYSPARVLFSLLVYLTFAIVLNRWASVGVVIGLEGFLTHANWAKESLTGETLVARDVLEVSQGASLSSYLGWEMAAFATLLVVALAIGVWKRPRFSWWRLAAGLVLPAMLGLRLADSGAAGKAVNTVLSDVFNAHYLSYNFNENAKQNGIFAHLYFTAESIKLPQRGPHAFYDNPPAVLDPAPEPDVALILCEACFTTTDDRFRTPIAELTKQGFAESNAISPVYGGGTSEAEFELLAGLSSQVLPGVDYQNFGPDYRDGAESLVSRFRGAGYHTAGIHNFYGSFWKRDTVYKHFGFDEQHFVETMAWHTRTWPSDALLYQRALDVYAAQPPKKKQFMFLVTVMTHGAYRSSDDGETDYRTRLAAAVKEMRGFVAELEKRAKKRKRPLTVIVVGDHKPSLTSVFYRKGVFDQSYFRTTGATNGDFRFAFKLTPAQYRVRGEVPVFIKSTGKGNADPAAMAARVAERPMFCLSSEVARLAGGNDRFWPTLAGICERSPDELAKHGKAAWQPVFPLPLYAERLF